MTRFLALLAAAWLAPTPLTAHDGPWPRHDAGSLVSLSVEVAGGTTPLYQAPDGSGRFYLEARRHAGYALRLANNTGERLGVRVNVDGLNVISGEREVATSAPGRMYVLGPWDSIVMRGWRTSLDDVRRFTFVDEERSYASRSAKANNKMGWIELAVFRERRPRLLELAPPRTEPEAHAEDAARDHAGSAEGPAAPAEDTARRSAPDAVAKARPPAEAPGSYPGTGWGARTHDPAVVVAFDPHPHPAERLTLRYEYAAGLRALGIDLRSGWWARDRLRQRDRGEDGFARPPAW